MLRKALCKHPTAGSVQFCRTLFGLFGQYNRDKYYNTADKQIVVHQETEGKHVPSITGRPRLKELSLKGIAEYMNTNQCQNILVLVGHNISAAAGIPNYRKVGGIETRKLTGDSGTYTEKTDAELLFEKMQFVGFPYAMFKFVQALWPGNHRPTLAHYFIRTLQEKGLLLRTWTENLDNLEKMAGIREDKLVEINGSFLRWVCQNVKCKREHDLFWLKERLEMYQLPNCSTCFEKTIPDIVFHSEFPSRTFLQSDVDARNCDLCIIIGSDLLLTPFCQIPHDVPWDVPRLVINPTPIELDTDVLDTQVLFDFDSDAAYRDVFWEGNTDLGILSLCTYLGWDKDVRYIMVEDTAALPGRKEMQERVGLKRPRPEHMKLTKYNVK